MVEIFLEFVKIIKIYPFSYTYILVFGKISNLPIKEVKS